jgi:hypothetical protein
LNRVKEQLDKEQEEVITCQFGEIEIKIVETYERMSNVFCGERNTKGAGCRWLISMILATQEAEIRRLEVQSQPREIVHELLSGKTHHKKLLVGWLNLCVL